MEKLRRYGVPHTFVRGKPKAVVVQAGCSHHWVIAPPDGETSDAVCKLCGDTKVFRNGYAKSKQPTGRKMPPIPPLG